jgi:hypothetical protein
VAALDDVQRQAIKVDAGAAGHDVFTLRQFQKYIEPFAEAVPQQGNVNVYLASIRRRTTPDTIIGTGQLLPVLEY